jgi:hypothetical protein
VTCLFVHFCNQQPLQRVPFDRVGFGFELIQVNDDIPLLANPLHGSLPLRSFYGAALYSQRVEASIGTEKLPPKLPPNSSKSAGKREDRLGRSSEKLQTNQTWSVLGGLAWDLRNAFLNRRSEVLHLWGVE